MFKIRKITLEDAEACFNTQHANHYHERGLYSETAWKFIGSFLIDSWVATVDNEVVGHCIGLIQNLDGPMIPEEYHNLLAYNPLDNCVHPDYRMNGISGALTTRICESYPMIKTQIHADNIGAEHILLTRDFKIVNEIKNFYLDGGGMKILIREG
tara:strand:- start:94 stop:558 length:465 start_codon:yes stop_codon:yes gene_type:complete